MKKFFTWHPKVFASRRAICSNSIVSEKKIIILQCASSVVYKMKSKWKFSLQNTQFKDCIYYMERKRKNRKKNTAFALEALSANRVYVIVLTNIIPQKSHLQMQCKAIC